MSNREQEQIEWVFGLTGGELSDEPWRCEDTETDRARVFQYWYDGAPDYAEPDFIDYDQVRTLVVQELYGAAPFALKDVYGMWRRVGSFTSSGECECPGKSETPAKDRDSGGLVEDSHCAGGSACTLCEEPKGSEHEYIYLGDGWAEVVYALVVAEEEPQE
jgi:hypothetical protein